MTTEECVMANAEPYHHIYIRLPFVQHPGLQNRVARPLKTPRLQLQLFRNPNRRLIHRTRLTENCTILETIGLQHLPEQSSLPDKPHASRQTNPSGPNTPGKLYRLLHTGQLAIKHPLHLSRRTRNPRINAISSILSNHPLKNPVIQCLPRTERRKLPRTTVTIQSTTLKTAQFPLRSTTLTLIQCHEINPSKICALWHS